MKSCPSCNHTVADCSYPGEAKPGCLRDKELREQLDVTLKAVPIAYARAQLDLRALFPDAVRIRLTPNSVEIDGVHALTLVAFVETLKVLIRLWGYDVTVTFPEYSVKNQRLRISRS